MQVAVQVARQAFQVLAVLVVVVILDYLEATTLAVAVVALPNILQDMMMALTAVQA
jgi:hypothetical protein